MINKAFIHPSIFSLLVVCSRSSLISQLSIIIFLVHTEQRNIFPSDFTLNIFVIPSVCLCCCVISVLCVLAVNQLSHPPLCPSSSSSIPTPCCHSNPPPPLERGRVGYQFLFSSLPPFSLNSFVGVLNKEASHLLHHGC